MTPLEKRVLGLVTQESLIPADCRVLVALSGGADSVALTLLLHDLAPVVGFTLAGVVHLNHGLRAAAVGDERFCQALAERLELPVRIRRVDVSGTATRERISVEEAGHRERYALFIWAVDALDADSVATAHTQDDQAETVLMRLLRGAGPVGLSGIHPRSGCVIRPLLDVSRLQLREYLALRGQPFREDETNSDLSITRNRVRHEVIPLLERRFSPSVVATLGREADIARYDAEWMETAARAAASEIVSEKDGVVILDRGALVAQPVALARRIAKQALERATDRSAGFDQVERLLTLARDAGRRRMAIDLPGCRVTGSDGLVTIGPPKSRQRVPRSDCGFRYELPIPGEVEVPEAGVVVGAERVVGGAGTAGLTARGSSVYVDESQLDDRLIVRNWRPGDILRPLGLTGHKKVQDLFVDRKVEREARQAVPMVVDRDAGIVWVVGHAVAHDFRISPSTEGMLLLRTRKLNAI